MKPIVLLVLVFLLAACMSPARHYSKGSRVKFSLSKPDSPYGRLYDRFESHVYELLELYSTEKKDFTYLQKGEETAYQYLLSVSIDSVILSDFAEHSRKYREASKMIDKAAATPNYGMSGTGAAIMGASIALAPVTGFILIPMGPADNLDWKSRKAIKAATGCSNMLVQIKLERRSSPEPVFTMSGSIQNCTMTPLNENQQIAQLLDILKQTIRDSIPFFQITE